MYMRSLEPDQISHTQSMVAKRTLTDRPNVHVKKSFKTPRGRIPIDPAILAAIGHRFIAQQKNMPTRGSEAAGEETRNWI